jgi:DNA-binding beta-propeller fold protein YncE
VTRALLLALAAALVAATPAHALRQLKGRDGCVSGPRTQECTRTPYDRGPAQPVVDPSGRYLYGIAPFHGVATVAGFARFSNGALRPLRGPTACVRRSVQGDARYARACKKARGLRDPVDVRMTPDGRHMYILTGGSEASADGGIVGLARGPNGSLRQPPGQAGCITVLARSACGRVLGLTKPRRMTISHDGANVYAISADGAVVTLRRDAGTGRLRQLAGEAGCAISRATPTSFGCLRVPIPDVRPRDIVIAPDGDFVYVLMGRFEIGVLAVFARDHGTGALAFVGCLARLQDDPCYQAFGLAGPRGLAISPDGRTVYVASHYLQDGGAVTTYSRQAPTGGVTQLDPPSGCWAALTIGGCARGPGWIDPNSLAVSFDNKTVYGAYRGGRGGGVLAIWSRDDFAGAIRYAGCGAGRIKGCARTRGLRQFDEVSVSVDGRTLYVGGTSVLGVFEIGGGRG